LLAIAAQMTLAPTSASHCDVPETRMRSTALLPVRISRGGIFFVILWLVLLAAGREKLFRDPGTFWHLALGEKLLASGELTRHDTFTFTFADRPWLSLQWLGEAAMALAYRAGGWDTLLLLTVTVLAATYTYLACRLMWAGLHWLPTAVIVIVVIAASSHHFHARPHLASIAFIGVTMACLCDIEAGRASLARLLWLLPVLTLWTNLHGGVLGGLGTVLLAGAGWSLLGMFGRGPVTNLNRAMMLVVLVLSFGTALLINPYGLEMPQAWLRIMSMPLPDLIQEHRPLSVLKPEGMMVAMLSLGYVWLLWDILRTPHSALRIRITWLLPLLWLALALLRVRHAPLFAITAGVALADMLPYTRAWSMVRSQESGVRSRGSGISNLLPACLVLVALGIQMLGIHLPLMGRGWARLDAEQWPVELLPELREIERESSGAQMFNTLDYGGFVTFHAPGLKTFIDDRCELFGTDFLARYATAEQREPQRIESWAEEYGFRYALVRAGSPFERYLQATPHWATLKRSAAAALYQRNN
jgi:hypothetical protein